LDSCVESNEGVPHLSFEALGDARDLPLASCPRRRPLHEPPPEGTVDAVRKARNTPAVVCRLICGLTVKLLRLNLYR
jgi:hypothetical protein